MKKYYLLLYNGGKQICLKKLLNKKIIEKKHLRVCTAI